MVKNLQKIMMLCLVFMGISMNASAWTFDKSLPANGATVTELSSIELDKYSIMYIDPYPYEAIHGPHTLTCSDGNSYEIYFSTTNANMAVATFTPITKPGTYTLVINKGDFWNGSNPDDVCDEQTYTWTIPSADATNYPITISPTIENGTVSVSGNLTEAEVGDEITLTATPADGYKFASWNVTANGEPVVVTNNKFTMPAAGVTISARFVSADSEEGPVLNYDAENCKITLTWPEGTTITQIGYDSPSITNYNFYWWFNVNGNVLNSSYVHIDNDGDYALTIPAGIYQINGVLNEEIVIPFTVGNPSAPIDIVISEALFATFVPGSDVDITTNANIEAYVVSSVEDGFITLAQTTQVPQGSAVIVKANAAGTYPVEKMKGATLSHSNVLKSSTYDFLATQANKYYVLANGDNGVGFYPVKQNSNISAYKGYLEISAANGRAMYMINWDTTTDIKGVVLNKLDGTREVYGLNGQRLQQMQRGINIVNGKKILVK